MGKPGHSRTRQQKSFEECLCFKPSISCSLLAFYSFFSINFVVHDDVSCLCEKNLNLGILFGKENCQIYQNFSQETHIY